MRGTSTPSTWSSSGPGFIERLFQAANRVGKTVCGAYEVTAHTTGQYKDWWEGKRFNHPTHGWAAGDTNETTRDIIQKNYSGRHLGGMARRRSTAPA
jgi:hypothetical protein